MLPTLQDTKDIILKTSKNVGEDMVLGDICEIYESKNEGVTSKCWISRDSNLLLRSETIQKGKVLLKMEVTELILKKLPLSLFEIPLGYQKVSLR